MCIVSQNWRIECVQLFVNFWILKLAHRRTHTLLVTGADRAVWPQGAALCWLCVEKQLCLRPARGWEQLHSSVSADWISCSRPSRHEAQHTPPLLYDISLLFSPRPACGLCSASSFVLPCCESSKWIKMLFPHCLFHSESSLKLNTQSPPSFILSFSNTLFRSFSLLHHRWRKKEKRTRICRIDVAIVTGLAVVMAMAAWSPALFVIAHSPVTSNGGPSCYCRKEMTEREDVSGRERRTPRCDRYLQEHGTCELSALKGISFTPTAESKFLEELSEAFGKEEHWIARQSLCPLTLRVRKRSALVWCLPIRIFTA